MTIKQTRRARKQRNLQKKNATLKTSRYQRRRIAKAADRARQKRAGATF